MAVKKKATRKKVIKQPIRKKTSIKKKVIRKKAPVKRKVIKKKVTRVKPILKRRSKKINPSKKINIILRNLLFFGILFVASLLLYSVTSVDSMYENLFFILSILFGFVEIAFLISLLVFVFLKFR